MPNSKKNVTINIIMYPLFRKTYDVKKYMFETILNFVLVFILAN